VSAWAAGYEELALAGVRSREVTDRIALRLHRFAEYLLQTYGHDWLATVVRRDVAGLRPQGPPASMTVIYEFHGAARPDARGAARLA